MAPAHSVAACEVTRTPCGCVVVQAWGQASDTILECDKVVVPVHLGMHWTCAVINLREKAIEYYDSLLVRGCANMAPRKTWYLHTGLVSKTATGLIIGGALHVYILE